MPTHLPNRPWVKVACDIGELNGKKYLVVVDYYSRWLEFAQLENMTGSTIVRHLKSMCARYGIFETLVADNYFDNADMNNFAAQYGFTLITSSPKFPSSNGMAEKYIGIFKGLAKKSSDLYLALLAYRATPLIDGLTPAEKLMGRKIRSNVPQSPSKLVPKMGDEQRHQTAVKDFEHKIRQKRYFDLTHNVHDKAPIVQGDDVFIRDRGENATVIRAAPNAPRSYMSILYIVETPTNTYRRNTRHLNQLPRRSTRSILSRPNTMENQFRGQLYRNDKIFTLFTCLASITFKCNLCKFLKRP